MSFICKNTCPLDTGRYVTFKGPQRTGLPMFIGEAPGRHEEEQLTPFVGSSGQDIEEQCRVRNIDISNVIISNCVFCRPPKNRTPTKSETKFCADQNLKSLISSAHPSRIVVFGGTAFNYICGNSLKITPNSGRVFWSKMFDLPVLVMLHPAYIQRNGYSKEIKARWDKDWDVAKYFIETGICETKDTWHIIETIQEVEKLANSEPEKIVFDWETTGTNFDAELLGLSIKTETAAYHIPFFDPKPRIEEVQSGKRTIKKMVYDLVPLWSSSELLQIIALCLKIFRQAKSKAAYNAKFDLVRLFKFFKTIDLPDIWHDILLMLHVYEPKRGGRRAEDFIRFYPDLAGYDSTREKYLLKSSKNYGSIPYRVQGNYCNGDTDLEWRLAKGFGKLLAQSPKRLALYQNIYVPLVRIYGEAEYRGLKVDIPRLEQFTEEFSAEIETQKVEFKKRWGCEIGSDKQIGELIFKKMKMKKIKINKTGPSTDKQVIEELLVEYKGQGEKEALLKAIEKYRGYAHQFSTYIGYPFDKKKQAPTGMWQHIAKDGRIHPSAKLNGTVTGRNSYEAPNMQNFPNRDERWRALRQIFIPDAGRWWLSKDLEQAELRIAAAASQDKNLLRVFKEGRDPHSNTARIIRSFGIPADATDAEVKKNYKPLRDLSKNIIFGAFYGGGAFGLFQYVNSRTTEKITLDEAEDFFKYLYEEFIEFFAWRADVMRGILQDGFIELPIGHIRYADPLKDDKSNQRELFNTRIQGTCGYILKYGIIAAEKHFSYNTPVQSRKANFLFDIHDDSAWDIDPDYFEEANEVVGNAMQRASEVVGGFDFMESDTSVYKERWGIKSK